MQYIYNQITKSLKKFWDKHHFSKAVIGLSGGIDSTLTLKLAVDAIGHRNVVGLLLPEVGVSSHENIHHAQKIAEFLKVEHHKVPINPFLVDFTHLPWRANDMAHANTKARIRMCLLYNYANSRNGIVLGTSNKSEILLGYGTKFGDLAADLEVIGELYKTEVWELAEFLGLPPEIINKPPTAELFPGQTDEKELGASYKELDPILINHALGASKLISKGMNSTLVRKTLSTIKKNQHKSEMPPVIGIKRK